MKTFNKRGDKGETSLLYGERVPKSHPRCEAYGTIDEVVSALGLARCFCTRVDRETLVALQRGLFAVGAELATPLEHREKLVSRGTAVTPEMVADLEKRIDELEARTPMPEAFVLPGGAPGAAALDLARAMLRRAERRAVALAASGEIANESVTSYLNRMADLIFALARYEEGEARIHV
ncbi:MAG: cob(I)yrinic acid a,c-diamide adenosyltransferase [Chloroflexi bacterium]|nr:cob(I)yrinic acid a,c-diamide adenosyltransferase [Chloroflexota bacterium]